MILSLTFIVAGGAVSKTGISGERTVIHTYPSEFSQLLYISAINTPLSFSIDHPYLLIRAVCKNSRGGAFS